VSIATQADPVRVARTNAHEGPVYVPGEHALYFTTLPEPRGERPVVDIKRLDLATGNVSVARADANVANGMARAPNGRLVVCEQHPAAISLVDPATGRSETLVDSWRGLRLNSPNDVVVQSDGTVWFTDPSYGYLQRFRPEPQVGDFVYRYEPASGRLSVVADSFDKPNGLAFSPDESILYVTDSGANQEPGSYYVDRPHHIVAFDVRDGRHLGPGRLFAVTTPGFPDGLKVDCAPGHGWGTVSRRPSLAAASAARSVPRPSRRSARRGGRVIASSYMVTSWDSSGRRPRQQSSQLGEHSLRPFEHVAVGVATKVVPAGVRLALAAAVLLPGVAGGVVGVAVELDGQVMVGPAAVDVPSACGAVRLWQRSSDLAQALEEALLELAERDAYLSAQDRAQLAGARAAPSALEYRLHLGRCRAVAHAGLVAGSGQRVPREYGGQVDERPGRARHWDAPPGRDVVCGVGPA
jgi:gluconolactonase